MRFLSALFLAALGSSPLSGQPVAPVAISVNGAPNGTMNGTMHMSPRRFAGVPVTGAPYSAQRVNEHVQVAADGTRFTTNQQQETVYRDSQGRTRTERPIMMAPPNLPNPAPDVPLLIEISDPIAKVGYTLDTQNKVAHRYALQSVPGPTAMPTGRGGGGSATGIAGLIAPAAPVFSAGRNAAPRPDMQHEDLGTQMIEGVLANGQRDLQTWPAGSQGSDRPFQTTSETWFSEDLKMPILNRNVDPRSGENTMKLININRAEPSATLFVMPPDYTVADEDGPFEIHWTSPRPQ